MSDADDTLPPPPRERRDALHEEIVNMRRELHEHIEDEMPLMRAMLQELGSPDQVRERRVFIELMISEAQDRRKLRIALTEKGLLVALVALIVFVGTAVWNEILAAIKLMIGAKP